MAPPMVQLYHNRNVNKNSLLFKVDYTRCNGICTVHTILPTDIIRVDFPKLCEESVLEEGVLDEDTAD